MATPTAVLWLCGIAGGSALALALVALLARPRSADGRILAALLAAEALIPLASVVPGRLADISWVVGASALPWLYLLFVRQLATPLVRVLQARGVRTALFVLLSAALTASALAAPAAVRGEDPAWFEAVFVGELVLLVASSLFALVATISAWRRASRGSLARDQARSYAAAFATRDLLLVLGIMLLLVLPDPENDGNPVSLALVGSGTLALAVLLSYGIFRVQLFGIDARVRWTLSAGALAIFSVAAFVVGSEFVTSLVTPRYGTAAGLAAVALLLPLLLPLKRAADRMTSGRDAPGADAAAGPRVWTPGAKILGRFVIVARLGEGGQARTYVAEDAELHRRVVLKVFRPQPGLADALREARAALDPSPARRFASAEAMSHDLLSALRHVEDEK